MDANSVTITSPRGNRESYADCHIYTCGTGSSSIAYTVDRSNPLTFAYPDTAHSERPAPANPNASARGVAAQPNAGSDFDPITVGYPDRVTVGYTGINAKPRARRTRADPGA
jgi:hypothetical protein